MINKPRALISEKHYLLYLFIAGLAASLPALLVYYPNTYDTLFAHMAFRSFSTQFYAGELYPRWLYDFYNGYGAPMFYYYPPFLFYFETLLDALTFRALPDLLVLGLTGFILVTGSGVACFYWLGDLFGAKRALLPSVIYMLLPNHLAVDFYLKGTLTELSAYLWFPLLFLCIRRSFTHTYSWIAVAFLYAALITSTVPMAVAFTPVFLFYIAYEIFVRLKNGESFKVRYALPFFALFLGFGLAGFHIVTAYLLTDIIESEKFWVGFYDPRTWFMCFFDCSASSGEKLSLAFSWLHILELLTITSLFMFCWKHRIQERFHALFWCIVAVGAVFMMSKYSLLLWDHLPLLERIQFPWRLAVALDLALCLFLALAFPLRNVETRLTEAFMILCVFGFSVFSVLQSYTFYNRAPLYTPEENTYLMQRRGYYDVYIPAYTDVTRDDLIAQDKVPPLIRIDHEDGTETALEYIDVPYGKVFELRSETPVTVRIRQLFYPTWEAYSKETRTKFDLDYNLPMGDMFLSYPGGRDTVVLHHKLSWQEKTGWGFTLISLLVLLGVLFQNYFSKLLPARKKPHRFTR